MGAKGTSPIRRLGAWLVRANNTVYQAATEGTVHAYQTGGTNPQGLTDAGNPPTTPRLDGVSGFGKTITMKVKKNHYWKVINCNYVWWIPTEP